MTGMYKAYVKVEEQIIQETANLSEYKNVSLNKIAQEFRILIYWLKSRLNIPSYFKIGSDLHKRKLMPDYLEALDDYFIQRNKHLPI